MRYFFDKFAVDTRVVRGPSWWQWAITATLLALHHGGVAGSLALAIALNATATVTALIWLRDMRPMAVQIRLAFLALLLFGLAPGLAWLHWVQLIGTTAVVLVGYCFLGRLLSLAPWNRSRRLTFALVKGCFGSRPVGGGVLTLASHGAESEGLACSLCRPSTANGRH